jgi:hypothetical protein
MTAEEKTKEIRRSLGLEKEEAAAAAAGGMTWCECGGNIRYLVNLKARVCIKCGTYDSITPQLPHERLKRIEDTLVEIKKTVDETNRFVRALM